MNIVRLKSYQWSHSYRYAGEIDDNSNNLSLARLDQTKYSYLPHYKQSVIATICVILIFVFTISQFLPAGEAVEFNIDSAARTDSGVYTVKATNQSGEMQQDIKVLVCGMSDSITCI